MNLTLWWNRRRVLRKFSDYRPQPVSRQRFNDWINQFPSDEDKRHIINVLNQVTYLTEDQTREGLAHQSDALLRRLQQVGVPPERVIYVQYDDPGSSSPVMLNLLRDTGQLEKRGCRLVDANRELELYKATNAVGEGAIVYVDDFIGTGNQFFQTRAGLSPQIVGTFAEFLLTVVICEEGMHEVSKRGVEPVSVHIDSRGARPLHPFSSRLKPAVRSHLEAMCLEIDPNIGMGYQRLASMTVLYRNAPDTFPMLFRGSPNQAPLVGLLPRAQDLPVRPL